jgi:hypothetical protein
MARVQVDSSVRAEALQNVTAPRVQGVNARFDPRADRAFQLAESLSTIMPTVNRIGDNVEKMQEKSGLDYANSLTVDELNKQIKDGSLSAAHSPVAVAAIHNVYGQNLATRIGTETQRKIESGELTFNDPNELDKYLKEQRQTTLGTSSKYSAAGFDKKFDQFKTHLLGVNSKYQAKRFEEDGAAQVYEALDNLQASFERPSEPVNSEERARQTKDLFKFFKDTGVLANPDKAREIWGAHLSRLADRGDINTVDSMLALDLGNGISLRSMLSAKNPGAVQAIENKVQSKYQGLLAKKMEEDLDVDAEAAIKNGAGAQIKDGMIPQADGTFKTIPADKRREIGYKRAIKDLPLDLSNEEAFSTRIRMAAVSDVKDMELKSELEAAISNIDTANWSASNKSVGDLSNQGMRSIELFRKVNAIAPNYTRTLLSDSQYQTLDTIDSIMGSVAGGDYARSAQMVSAANKARKDDPVNSKKMRDDVESKLNGYLDPSWIWNPVETFKGMVSDNTVSGVENSAVVVTKAKKLAEIYYLSRQYNSPAEAAEAATEYIRNSTVKINNFTYDVSELPTVPKGYSQAVVMERYIKDKVLPISDEQKLNFKADELKLRPSPVAPGTYQVVAGGMPLTDKNSKLVYVTNKEIEEWAKTAQSDDMIKASNASEYKQFKDRLASERKELEKKDRYATARYDSTYNGFHTQREISSPEAFAKLKAEGLDKKPLSELMSIMKERRGKQ